MRCQVCSTEIPAAHRFCGSCGTPLLGASQRPTAVGLESPALGPGVARIASGPDLPRDAFTPGMVLDNRYRVIGLLGQGGMGVVYRADDLKLGTPVALKFLPRALADDAPRRERLLDEVRMARQVSHPNVCRVYDIGELGGALFLSMEYIDGEDLASLLERIGRLPPDKALDIARQACAGLAAAHARGILHRDLKPANVMLDGRGRVRITDFGLAVAASASRHDIAASGTPAYMAPEQLTGGKASIQSDVYALGLLLYELYTGKRAFAARTLEELVDRKRHELPVAPSTLVREMEPAVERVILRAIATDPRDRPATVLQVAAALPGGDLLQAALGSGEMPSPEMLAASGSAEGLKAAAAWTLAAVVAAGTAAATFLGAETMLWRRAALERSPEVLAEQARGILARLGYTAAPADDASGFETDVEYLRYIRTRDRSRARWNQSNPGFFRFWYRQSPQPLESWRFIVRYGNLSRVDPSDPPLDVDGMTRVQLDPSGRLVELVVVPAPVQPPEEQASGPDWTALLTAGGYDPAGWTAVAPRHTPPFYADARAAWEGPWPNRSDLRVRLEAAALQGRPVYFEAIFPWSQPKRTAPSALTAAERTALVLLVFGGAALIVTAVVFASRNLRAGRGDRRGAWRLAAFIFATMWVAWFFGEAHVTSLGEVTLVIMALAWSLLVAACCCVGYLAAEPFVRRQWPWLLVSWVRVLSGNIRDRLVGRDVLIGCAGGVALTVVGFTGILIPGWLGRPPELVPADIIGVAYGLQRVAAVLVWRLGQSVVTGLAALFVLLILHRSLRREWLAVAGFVLLSSLVVATSAEYFWIVLMASAIVNGLFVFLLLRVGLLAAVVAFYISGLLIVFPVTADFSRWYAGAGVVALLTLAALTTFGFTTAVSRRPMV